MDYQEMLDKIGAVKDAATVQRVFGEPQTSGDKTLMPVAEIRTCLGMGHGGGEGPRSEENACRGEGGGGGAGLRVRPAGIVEITPEETTFIPIKPPIHPAWMLLGGFIIGLWWASRRNHRRQEE